MKPFLKWAGNKHQIIDDVVSILPAGNRLIEPFVGSGSVFLNTDYHGYVVADINNDLINLYNLVKDEGIDFIEYCRTFFVPAHNDESRYYELRTLFNTTIDTREKSALFVYLNRHCFNGLCRYNSKGGFNVPFGKYDNPYFPEQEMINFNIKSQDVFFVNSDFESFMDSETFAGDVVYCDPPYMALTDTANFTDYAQESFTDDDHIRLVNKAKELRDIGIPVIISNQCTSEVLSLYDEADKIMVLPVQRYMAADGDSRKKVKEVLAIFGNNLILETKRVS
jgi:DNA adenine methylase